MEEIRENGTTILMVTHDMGSIIKYCDRVVLLNKGEFIAEGTPSRVVDMYKKILAGKLEALKAELAAEQIGETQPSADSEEEAARMMELSDFSGGMNLAATASRIRNWFYVVQRQRLSPGSMGTSSPKMPWFD